MDKKTQIPESLVSLPSLDKISRAIFFAEDTDIFTEDTAKNLQVYKNNHMLGLISSLLKKYPVIVKVLSENNFKYFAQEFIKAHPSTTPNKDFYGAGFPEFLGQRSKLASMIYLKSLANMDWFYFNVRGKESSIELPVGVFALWEALFADEDMDDIEIEENIETIKAQVTNSQVHFAIESTSMNSPE